MRLSRIIENILVSWAKDGFVSRTAVAREHLKKEHLPFGMTLTPQKILGPRVISKGRRIYGNRRNLCAVYPDAGLHEIEMPRIVCAVRGGVNFQVGNYLLGCAEGHVIVIPPHVPHPGDAHVPATVHPQATNPSCTLLWIALYRQGIQCWLTSYDSNNRTGDASDNYLFTNNGIIQLSNLLVEEAMGESDHFMCDGLFLAFASALRRECAAQRYLRPGLPVSLGEDIIGGESFSAQLREYIQNHLHEPLTMERVARGLFMFRVQLARYIRRESDQTFLEMLDTYRLKEAKKLLTESDWTIQVITEFVGFKSPSYFNHFFQRHEGMTPGKFRINQMKQANLSKNTEKPKKLIRKHNL